MQKKEKKLAVQMKDDIFNEKDSIPVIEFLTECELAWHSSNILEGVTVWHFQEFMNGSVHVTIKQWLTLPSTDRIGREGILTLFIWGLNNLERRYATDTVTTTADEEIGKFKQFLLTPWDFPKTILDLNL